MGTAIKDLYVRMLFPYSIHRCKVKCQFDSKIAKHNWVNRKELGDKNILTLTLEVTS